MIGPPFSPALVSSLVAIAYKAADAIMTTEAQAAVSAFISVCLFWGSWRPTRSPCHPLITYTHIHLFRRLSGDGPRPSASRHAAGSQGPPTGATLMVDGNT